ncbi:hypothetical protein [Microtetraspora niveoalba]|uniref:hypothetical protein n=1 Tax=Microtetraspora niveoalba TaxID=46175 RepID=UPI000A984F6C|nr:hypothetical protein [Microtetraspora niveoalba]
MRPAVGDRLRRCSACGCWEYGGAPDCPRCRILVDEVVESGWREFLTREFGAVMLGDEQGIAAMVVDEPDRHDWRVVDAAMDRLVCPGCGSRLGAGPVGCGDCDRAHGFRYSAIETDRPGVHWGNEHAIRVNVSIVRAPHRTSAADLLARRVSLAPVLVGHHFTIEVAQRMGAMVKRGATYAELACLFEPLSVPADS